MKSFKEYIIESIVNEGEEKFVKFHLYGCDNSKTAIEDIRLIGQRNNIYVEPIDDGFMVKVKPGMDVTPIVSRVQELIDSVPEDKKEELANKTERIQNSIDKMNKAAEKEEEPIEKKDDKNKEEE